MEHFDSEDMSIVCRVCLTTEGGMYDFFGEIYRGVPLSEIFAETTQVNVEKDDGLSPHICTKCTSTIIDFHDLKSEYLENEKAFLEHVAMTKKMGKNGPVENGVYEEDELEESEEPIVIEIEVYSETDQEFQQSSTTEKPHTCDACGASFRKKSYLLDHKDIHETRKKYVCRHCKKAFQRRTVLVKHERIHTHPRECICEQCGKAFNDKGTLKTHIMLVHVKTRNFPCNICHVKFPLKATLEKHIQRHQNKGKLFFCTKCPLGYKDNSSLKRHIETKHSGGERPKPVCNICGKRYISTGNLLKHQRNCHGHVKRPN